MTDSSLLDRFLQHLRVERALSAHTVGSYRRDVEAFLGYLSRKGKSAAEASREDLADYLWQRKAKGGEAARSPATWPAFERSTVF